MARSHQSIDLSAVAFATDLGWMAVAYRERVLCGLVFGYASQRRAADALRHYLGDEGRTLLVDTVTDPNSLPQSQRELVERLERYAMGEIDDFSEVDVDHSHLTSFGRRVAAACRRIPRGQTRTYGQLAAVAGSPGAARAVGQVMAGNRYPLIVPCHRVVGASGSLGGFSAPDGLAMKRRLLDLESGVATGAAG